MKKNLWIVLIMVLVFGIFGCKDNKNDTDTNNSSNQENFNFELEGKWVYEEKYTTSGTIQYQVTLTKKNDNKNYNVVREDTGTTGSALVNGNIITVIIDNVKLEGQIKDNNTVINGKLYENDVLQNNITWSATRGELPTQQEIGAIQDIGNIIEKVNQKALTDIYLNQQSSAVKRKDMSFTGTVNGDGGGKVTLNITISGDNMENTFTFKGDYIFDNYKSTSESKTINGKIESDMLLESNKLNQFIKMSYKIKTTNLTVDGVSYSLDIVYYVEVDPKNSKLKMDMTGTVNGKNIKYKYEGNINI